MKQRVVYLFYHGFGHINSLLKSAAVLEENNYEVYFAGSGFFHSYISHQGYKFYLLKSYPFGLGLEKWINTIERKNSVFFSSLWDRITDRVFNEREVDLYWMLQDLKPAIVLIDTMLSTDFIVMYSYLKKNGIRIATINTMLPTQVSAVRPPLNSDVIPTDLNAGLKAVRKMNSDKRKKKWLHKLMLFGFDDRFIIHRRIKKNHIPKCYISVTPNLLMFSLDDVDEFILAPQEFDFPNFTPNRKQRFMGFMMADARVEIAEKIYEDLSKVIFARKRENRLHLIYCSFGTVPIKQRHAIVSFMQKLCSIAAEGNLIVVISTKVDVHALLALNENVYVFNSVPQLEVLMNADLFITHGGLNSIKEAVYAEVPMLVYPVHPEYDPRGNAARVLYHRLGLRGDVLSESIDDIRQKIDDVLSDRQFKENLRRLKNIDRLYNSSRFTDAIHQLTPLK
jgi:zeaxanthin glucosyltransferase